MSECFYYLSENLDHDDVREFSNFIHGGETDNEKLKQRNKLLYADTDDLKSGVEAIEERARNELGMIKTGETFFRIIPRHQENANKTRQLQHKERPRS